MANKTMHHVVIGADTFELIDEAGREETTALKEELNDNVSDLKNALGQYYIGYQTSYLSTATDIDQILDTGYYWIDSPTSYAHFPVQTTKALLIVYYLADYVGSYKRSQVFIDCRTGIQYVRYRQVGMSTWSSWVHDDWRSVLSDYLKNNGNFANTDFNSYTTNGYYYIQTSSAQNGPSTNVAGILQVNEGAPLVQKFTGVFDGIEYIRYYAANSWSSWQTPNSKYVKYTDNNIDYQYVVNVSTAAELYTTVRGMNERTHVIVQPGTYDISAYIEATPTAEMIVKNGCCIEGLGEATIICRKTTPNSYPSIFKFAKGNGKIKNLKLIGSNIRYIIHDDLTTDSEVPGTHITEDCILIYEGAAWSDFTYPRCYGAGVVNNGITIIKNCILEGPNKYGTTENHCIDFHSNSCVVSSSLGYPQPAAGGKIIITGCYSESGTLVCGTLSEDQGLFPIPVIASNNKFHGDISVSGVAFTNKCFNNDVT